MLVLPVSLAPLGCYEEDRLPPIQTQYKLRGAFAGLGNRGLFSMLGTAEERDCQLQAFFGSIQMQPQKVTSAHLVLDPSVSRWGI